MMKIKSMKTEPIDNHKQGSFGNVDDTDVNTKLAKQNNYSKKVLKSRAVPTMPNDSAKPKTACKYCGVLFRRPKTHENYCKRRKTAEATAAAPAASQ
jgi:hypothetical protein